MGVVVGVDPGREKCGIAVLAADGQVLYRAVVPVDQVSGALDRLLARYRPAVLVVGDRTGSARIVEQLRRTGLLERLGGVERVDEHLSSVEGRQLYWRHRSRRGWRRFIPSTMLTPPEPYDDFVAEVLVRRFLVKKHGAGKEA